MRWNWNFLLLLLREEKFIALRDDLEKSHQKPQKWCWIYKGLSCYTCHRYCWRRPLSQVRQHSKKLYQGRYCQTPEKKCRTCDNQHFQLSWAALNQLEKLGRHSSSFNDEHANRRDESSLNKEKTLSTWKFHIVFLGWNYAEVFSLKTRGKTEALISLFSCSMRCLTIIENKICFSSRLSEQRGRRDAIVSHLIHLLLVWRHKKEKSNHNIAIQSEKISIRKPSRERWDLFPYQDLT